MRGFRIIEVYVFCFSKGNPGAEPKSQQNTIMTKRRMRGLDESIDDYVR